MKARLNRITGTVASGALIAAASAGSAFAQIGDGLDATKGAADTGATDINSIVQRVINVLLFVVGAASVIMLIIGGIRYVVSAGDQQAVTNAKNTILYAIVGIVVAVLAYAAVRFVFGTLTNTSTSG
jgi:cytochrome bd-type quinol oxidase subunit 2